MSGERPSSYPHNDYYAALKARAGEIEARFRARAPKSAEMNARAKKVIPGGFTRDALIRSPYAPYVVEGRGSHVADLDGNDYVDFCYNATSLVLGHADGGVVEAVARQASLGTAYYAPNTEEVELAELLVERLPSAEQVRFTNSGSEAVMMAIRIARGATGRSLLIKFEGSYHGTYDDVQWSVNPSRGAMRDAAGRPNTVADTAGLTSADGRVLVLPYNDAEAVRAAMREVGAKTAAIIVEPMANRIGLILPEREFLDAVIESCRMAGAVSIFDEVIAFRLGHFGCQGNTGLTPDLTTLGKCIGGGLPVGAVAGRQDILQRTAPSASRRITHAGTFNGNPLTMVAGLATMSALDLRAFEALNAKGERMRQALVAACEGLPLTISGAGSLFKINAIGRPIRSYTDSVDVDGKWQQFASTALLNEGFMVSKGLQGCVSTVTTEVEIAAFASAVAVIVRG